MAATGIIAEFNPLHNGHARLLASARALCGGPIIVAMSGPFVQRGEPALCDKHLRARWALRAGADMVLELPAAFAVSCAQRFAAGGVRLLAGTGLVDTLCFGSESGDITMLSAAAARLQAGDAELQTALRARLDAGLPYPAALSGALGALQPAGPNDMLGIEYLRALQGEATSLRPVAIPRTEGAGVASAATIRKALLQGGDVSPFLPAYVDPAAPYRRAEALSDAVLYALRRRSKAELRALADVSEGLENVLYREARAQTSYSAFLAACKTKRYTMARLKRISMCALLDISAEAQNLAPYIRVLGIRAEARGLLSALYENAVLPVVTRYKETEALPADARRLHALDLRAGEIAALAAGTPAAFDYAEPLLVVS